MRRADGTPDTVWQIAAQSAQSALLVNGPAYLHVTRLADGSWFVDSGGRCGSGDAQAPK